MRKGRMGIWALVLLLGAALFTACNPEDNTPPPEEKGTLAVTVIPSDATVSVLQGGTVVYTQTGGFTREFDPGDYTVRGEKPGYNAAEEQVTVEAGATTTVELTLARTDEPPPPTEEPEPVANLEITKYYDQWGYPFHTRKEVNLGKDVDLFAAQYEDVVCVDVLATNAEGDPVSGAQINVAAYGVYEASVVPGCATDGTEPSVASTPNIYTDANGEATFSIYLAPSDRAYPSYEIEKFVVSATSAGETALEEFKVFFYNIDHLYYDDNLQDDFVTPDQRAGQRMGFDFGTFINTFRNSEHTFDTVILWGQPQYEQVINPGDLGLVIYEITGADASKVVFDNCDNPVDADTCKDYDGLVTIDLAPGVSQEDLPVEVTVKATLSVRVKYGDHTYWFPLKDYTFKKRWVGAFLTIDKVIDHHVVTWKGPEHTLDQVGNLGDPWIATYTITVENPSQQTATNVTITDALPPELGYVEGSATPAATYDSVLHQLTWTVGDLAPGDSVQVSFSVYARQKPGFCWDGDAYYYGARPPQAGSIEVDGSCDNPYSDPYQILNGRYTDDVTVEADDIDPIDYVPVPENVVLWVVRPLLEVNKDIILPGGGLANSITVLEDDNVNFVFSVENLDRSGEAGYASLIAAYPNEFDGTDYANPYAANVSLDDYFDTGLDYDSSIGGTWSGVDPKHVDFGTVPLLAGFGSVAFDDVTLSVTASEPTDADDPWLNCAYTDADNLNQPEAPNYQGIDWPFDQVQKEILGDLTNSAWFGLANPPHQNIPGANDIAGKLESCVTITVLPRETGAILTLSTVKEHTEADPHADETDPVNVGDTYWYFFLVNADDDNSRNVNDIELSLALDDSTKAEFTGQARVLVADGSAGGQWQDFPWTATTLTVAGYSSSALVFNEYDGLPAGHYLLYMVEVRAKADPRVTIEAIVSNSDADNQATIDKVQEQTRINP